MPRGRIAGNFSLAKFNVTLDGLCVQPLGMLADSMQGNPNVTASGNCARRCAGKSQIHPAQKCPSHGGIWTPSIT